MKNISIKTEELKIQSIEKEYDRKNLLRCIGMVLGIGLLIFCAMVTVVVGTANVSIGQVKETVLEVIFRGVDHVNTMDEKIIIFLRLPRIVLAILAGAGLSISGVIMQGITKNPLVSPFTIGISSAAAFGASLVIVFGFGIYTEAGIVLNAFVFSLICAILVYGISMKIGMSPESLILTGIALNYLFSAFTGTIHFFAQEHQLAAAVSWTFGSLNGATWRQVFIIGVVLVFSIPVLLYYSWIFNAMSSGGDELVKGLGKNPIKVRAIAGIITVLITASIISFTGVIGFVGLVGPHIARLVVGGDHRFLIPYSAIFGSILILISDTIGRTILSPVNIPVGIVISYLGVPLFINLILTRRKGYF